MRDALPLPTLSLLQLKDAPENVDALKVASTWLESLESNIEAGKIDAILNSFVENCYWRDILALTWDFRTFDGPDRIRKFLSDCLPEVPPSSFKIKQDEIFGYQRPYPDLAWIQSSFEFETKVGLCSGILRLVPLPSGEWKCHSIFTNLEGLKGFPELLGSLRNPNPNHGKWAADRERELSFVDSNPKVIIVGGGQSGLEIAARLKVLGINSLIVEKNARIGDNWRNRYQALCLHDPVWYDHMPYIPFPKTWPVYTPALKIANWLESYAENMELNVWTSSKVSSASPIEGSKKWKVTVDRDNGGPRNFTVDHVIFATGLGGGNPTIPTYPGMDKFKGQILHSKQHDKATDHAGKKVVVVGACTSAHDISVDYADHGVDITMFQRSSTYIMTVDNGWKILFAGLYEENGPPVDLADRVSASFSNVMKTPLVQRQVHALAGADKEILDGLHKVGFRTNLGYQDTGFSLLAWGRAGGYYLDVGGSQYIIDGKIKLKNDSQIQSFTETGLKFENGSELPADVVVFATGLGDSREHIRDVCGDALMDKVGPIWGLDDEGELNGAWRDVGVPGLWYMMGNLCLCRFHSKHVALQIKAMDEGLFGARYKA